MMKSFSLFSLFALLILFSSGGEAQTCNFRPYHMPTCTEDICSKFCVANYGPKIGSHCLNSITCCCEENAKFSEEETCTAQPYPLPSCNPDDCLKLCQAKTGSNGDHSHCTDPSTCCCP